MKPEKSDDQGHWQDEKFQYSEDFGEMLNGKKHPAMYIFDCVKNELEKVVGLPKNLYPCYPTFDKSGEGLVFHGIDMPNKKLGAIACLNRPTSIFKVIGGEVERLNPESEYLAM